MLKAAEWCGRGSALACQCFCGVKSSDADARCAASQPGFCLLTFIVCFCECLASNNKCPKNLEHVRTDEGLRKGKFFLCLLWPFCLPLTKVEWNWFYSQLRPLIIFTCRLKCSSHLNSMKDSNSLSYTKGLFPFSMILVQFCKIFYSLHYCWAIYQFKQFPRY